MGSMASRERGRPARTKPGTALPISPLGSTGNGAMALLRPGRWGSRPQGGCLQHRTKAQRRPKGQDAGGTPRAPRAITPPLRGSRRSRAARRRLMRWGVGLRVTSQKADVHPLGNSRLPASRAPALPCGSFQEKRLIVNEDEPRMDTKRHEDRCTSFNDKRHPNASAIWCPWWVTMSWDDGFLGARASRPHQAWHSLGQLPHLEQPATAPWLSFGLADGVPADSGGCLQHRTEAQRRPKGQHAGGTPVLPGQSLPP